MGAVGCSAWLGLIGGALEELLQLCGDAGPTHFEILPRVGRSFREGLQTFMRQPPTAAIDGFLSR
jgi:hypothetical protein